MQTLTQQRQPVNLDACADCQAGRCCGKCWCCYAPWPSASVHETKTEYNAHTGQWLTYPAELSEVEALSAGKITIFPAGPEGRRAAQLSALAHDAPRIAAEVEKIIGHHPNNIPLIDRAIRAGFLVHQGHVKAPRPLANGLIGECCLVFSQSEPGEFYAVTEYDQGMYCECDDRLKGQNIITLADYYHKFPEAAPKTYAPFLPGTGPTCKHIIAFLIVSALGCNLPAVEVLPAPQAIMNKMRREIYYSGWPRDPRWYERRRLARLRAGDDEILYPEQEL